MIKLDWQEAKQFLVLNMFFKYVQLADSYKLFLIDGPFIATCVVFGDDLLEFESLFKSKGNKNINLKDSNGQSIIYQSAFSSKALPEGKIYRRMHGVEFELQNNSITKSIFVIPYQKCKINKIMFLDFSPGCKANFKILDTVVGSYTGAPNYVLNQFAFNAYITKDYHEDFSEYDAEVYQGMQIEIEILNPGITFTARYNIVLHEIKQ